MNQSLRFSYLHIVYKAKNFGRNLQRQSEIGTYYCADGSRTMDLVSDVKGTPPAGCYCAFAFCGGFEVPYHVWKSGMFDEFGCGEGHFEGQGRALTSIFKLQGKLLSDRTLYAGAYTVAVEVA